VETIGNKRSYALTRCMPNNDDDDDDVLLLETGIREIQQPGVIRAALIRATLILPHCPALLSPCSVNR